MGIFGDIYKLLSSGKAVALVTVVHTEGSTPQVPGAVMAVNKDGTIAGTVGGGNVERLIIEDAVSSLQEGHPALKTYILSEKEDTKMVCGGRMQVFIEPLKKRTRLCKLVDDEACLGKRSVLSFVVSGKNIPPSFIGRKMLVTSGGVATGKMSMGKIDELAIKEASKALKENISYLKTYPLEEDKEVSIFFQVVPGTETLVIAGAGHIASSLVKMARVLDFRVVVVDDREDYAKRSRFPLADKIICGDFKKVFSSMYLNEKSYVVVVTYGHKHDEEVLEEVLKSKAGYIGCIGSRLKAEKTLYYLKSAGYSDEDVKRVHIPVGLHIGAKTPAEIALSILAQIIKEKRKMSS
ncbi:XdhC family protein [Candidatus Aerophobetes bacterium]|nr:XdhC family protein [Candidatus Aerophobetes bacterium]